MLLQKIWKKNKNQIGLIGSPQTSLFTFDVIGAVDSQLALCYKRAWEQLPCAQYVKLRVVTSTTKTQATTWFNTPYLLNQNSFIARRTTVPWPAIPFFVRLQQSKSWEWKLRVDDSQGSQFDYIRESTGPDPSLAKNATTLLKSFEFKLRDSYRFCECGHAPSLGLEFRYMPPAGPSSKEIRTTRVEVPCPRNIHKKSICWRA